MSLMWKKLRGIILTPQVNHKNPLWKTRIVQEMGITEIITYKMRNPANNHPESIYIREIPYFDFETGREIKPEKTNI